VSTRLFAIVFLVWALFWLLVLPLSKAFAHGDAEWIMREPRYVDRVGIHCCGPSDCGPVPAGEITETDNSVSHGGQTLMKRERGVYWSIDERHWVCRRFDGLKCIFIPQPGS
jgi:hypothetical protein